MEISRLQYSKVTSQLRHRRLIKLPLLFFIFLILAPSSWYLYAALQNPLPVISAIPQVITIEPKKPLVIPWPRIGQAAVGSLEEGLINSSSTNLEAVPIASTAKIITSLAVMRVKPFSSGTNGQMITLSDADVAYYEQYRALGGSTVLVSAGEQISEYQALQAMLLPSANNMADSIAVWAFGSTDAYVTYANNMLKEFGLTKTVISDPSGWSPKTKSYFSNQC
jgi:D-alanyl-D-alanine carboxypeptidase (penicillin-binding protein 5/6)